MPNGRFLNAIRFRIAFSDCVIDEIFLGDFFIMSKNYPEKEVNVNDLSGEELNALAADETEAAPKRIFSRILAVLLALAPIALVCFLPVTLLLKVQASGESGLLFTNKTTLLKVFMNIFKEDGLTELYKAIGAVTANGTEYPLAELAPKAISKFQGVKFLPYLNDLDRHTQLYSMFLYVIPVVFVLNLIFMIVGVCSGKKAPAMVRTIAYMNLIAFGGYALITLWLSSMYNFEVTEAGNIQNKLLFDYTVLGIAGGSLLLYIIYSFVKNKGKATVPFILFLLTAGFVGVYAFAYLHYNKDGSSLTRLYELMSEESQFWIKKITWGTFYKWAVRIVLSLIVLAFFFSTARLAMKKGYGFDIFRYILNLVVAGLIVAVYFLGFKLNGKSETKVLTDGKWFAVAAASIALVQMIVCIVTKVAIKNKEEQLEYEEEEAAEAASAPVAEEPAAPAPAPAPVAAPVYANGYAAPVAPIAPVPVYVPVYTPAPAPAPAPVAAPAPAPAPVAAPAPAPVEEEEQLVIPNFSSFKEDEEEAEETPVVAPAPVAAPAAAPAPVAPASNSYYATQTFDPFIASLSDKEREQFTNLFVLKYNGAMGNLPDYVVGGNNDDFFRKVFIYLGQYRDRIPNGLLAKMYKFAVRK